jgi:hypothetical protein
MSAALSANPAHLSFQMNTAQHNFDTHFYFNANDCEAGKADENVRPAHLFLDNLPAQAQAVADHKHT